MCLFCNVYCCVCFEMFIVCVCFVMFIVVFVYCCVCFEMFIVVFVLKCLLFVFVLLVVHAALPGGDVQSTADSLLHHL